MSNVTPPADDRVHSAEDNSEAITEDEELDEADLTEDEKLRRENFS